MNCTYPAFTSLNHSTVISLTSNLLIWTLRVDWSLSLSTLEYCGIFFLNTLPFVNICFGCWIWSKNIAQARMGQCSVVNATWHEAYCNRLYGQLTTIQSIGMPTNGIYFHVSNWHIWLWHCPGAFIEAFLQCWYNIPSSKTIVNEVNPPSKTKDVWQIHSTTFTLRGF